MNKIKQKKGLNLVKRIFKLLPSIDTFINDTGSKEHRSSKSETRVSVNFQSNNVHRSHGFRQNVVSVHKTSKTATGNIHESKEREAKELKKREIKEFREREVKKGCEVEAKEDDELYVNAVKQHEVKGFNELIIEEDKELNVTKAKNLEMKKDKKRHINKAKEQKVKKTKECEVKDVTGEKVIKTKEYDVKDATGGKVIKTKEYEVKDAAGGKVIKTKECEVKDATGGKVIKTKEKDKQIEKTDEINPVKTSIMTETKERGKLENILVIQKNNYICLARKDESRSVPMPLFRNSQDSLSLKQQPVDYSLKVCPSSKTVVINSYDFRVPAPEIRYMVPSNINQDKSDLQKQLPPVSECGVESISSINLNESFSFNFSAIRKPKILKLASHLIINCVKKAFSGDNEEKKPFSCVKYEQMVVKDSNDNEATIFQYYKSSAKKNESDCQSQFFLSFLQTFDDYIPDIPYSTTTLRTIISFRKTNDSFSCVSNINQTPSYHMGLPLSIPTDLSLLHWSSFSYQNQSVEGSLSNKYVDEEDSIFFLLNKDAMAPIDILCKALQNTVPDILYEKQTHPYSNDEGKCRALN